MPDDIDHDHANYTGAKICPVCGVWMFVDYGHQCDLSSLPDNKYFSEEPWNPYTSS